MKITDPEILSLKKKPRIQHSTGWVAILGNPNSGKTAIFNRLTGLHGKVGNYPGVTVEKKTGLLKDHRIIVQDLPGSYSLNAKSLDEQIVLDTVQSWSQESNRPLAAIVVLDATNLSRNIYLAAQVAEWGVPTIIVLNMMDEARTRGIHIEARHLKERLNVYAVIPASAKYGEGIGEIIGAISAIQTIDKNPPLARIDLADERLRPFHDLAYLLDLMLPNRPVPSIIEAIRLTANNDYLNYYTSQLTSDETEKLSAEILETRLACQEAAVAYDNLESSVRYKFIDTVVAESIYSSKEDLKNLSEKIDAFLTHPVWGPVSLVMVLGFIFNAVFSWAEYPMNWITSGVEWVSAQASLILPAGVLKSLLVDGIIAGVGNVIVFVPQIILLMLFLSLLEDSGYIARMAFMLDRLMSKVGLQGKSVLPMLSGFACAIPAVMSTRTIENWQDRIRTIMIIPLMSCSARLPIYTLLISAFIPHRTIWGFLQLQSLVLMGIYFLGFATAVFASYLAKRSRLRKTRSKFILEMPPYRWPLWRSVWWKVYSSTKLFMVNAGSIILAISIVLWFLASYPKPENEMVLSSKQKIEQSYAGQLGHLIEPLIQPLGFDWKMGVGIISSFAAREVLVSFFATIYNIQDQDNGKSISLVEAMRKDTYPDGRPVFTTLVAISLLVFFVYAAQCMSTFAIVRRETNSWKWPLIMVGYMNSLAFIFSLLIFQGGKLLGLG